jgi:hypothetical protein
MKTSAPATALLRAKRIDGALWFTPGGENGLSRRADG